MLHPDTFQFLAELRENNHKAWFDENRNRYQTIRQHVVAFVASVIDGVSAIDTSLPPMEASKQLFRINRDIRFSKDKSPYKTNMGAYFAPDGKDGVMAGYYIHIEPQGCFLAGGCYMPPPPVLRNLRNYIAYAHKDFAALVQQPEFIEYFGKVTGESLASVPKGFDKEHPAAEWLKLKSFTVSHRLPDEVLLSSNATETVLNGFQLMRPFIAFINEGLSLEADM